MNSRLFSFLVFGILVGCSGGGSRTRVLPAPPQTVSITVSPTSATVVAGGSQAFSATVTGAANMAVTWTANAGSVSPAGLFTAPSGAATVTVTATAVADTTKTATAMVTVVPAPVAAMPTGAVFASGRSQKAGQIQNSPIVGENITPGATASSPTAEIRHGFGIPQ